MKKIMDKTFKLPKVFAEKWVEALRSGEYEKGIGYLFKYNTYCCLGVGCVILGADKNTMAEKEITTSSDWELDILKIKNSFPRELQDTELMENLIYFNDNEGKSFNEIADWLEENCEFYE